MVARQQVNPLVLNPDDEFEAVLVDIVKTYRKKTASYGEEAGDPLWNFIVGAEATNSTPLRFCESLLAKHSMALRQWFKRVPDATVNPAHTTTSNDGYLDRAVYSILANVLYRRDK